MIVIREICGWSNLSDKWINGEFQEQPLGLDLQAPTKFLDCLRPAIFGRRNHKFNIVIIINFVIKIGKFIDKLILISILHRFTSLVSGYCFLLHYKDINFHLACQWVKAIICVKLCKHYLKSFSKSLIFAITL